MATTKLFSISVTESKALAYIASPAKTENRRLIYAYGCSPDPYQASRDFEAVSEYCYELDEYQKAVKKLKDWYPSGSVPSLELLRKTIGDLEAEQKQKKQLYTQTADETETLSKCLQKIEQYLGNEQERAEEEQRRKRKKSGDLE